MKTLIALVLFAVMGSANALVNTNLTMMFYDGGVDQGQVVDATLPDCVNRLNQAAWLFDVQPLPEQRALAGTCTDPFTGSVMYSIERAKW